MFIDLIRIMSSGGRDEAASNRFPVQLFKLYKYLLFNIN